MTASRILLSSKIGYRPTTHDVAVEGHDVLHCAIVGSNPGRALCFSKIVSDSVNHAISWDKKVFVQFPGNTILKNPEIDPNYQL